MKKELKKQIRAAEAIIINEDWNAGIAFQRYGWTRRTLLREIPDNQRRKIVGAAKNAVKAFRKTVGGAFIRPTAERIAARRALAELIFYTADAAMVEMLENNND